MLVLVIGATLIGLVANIVAWKMPRTSNMMGAWAAVSSISGVAALVFGIVAVIDGAWGHVANVWWLLPAFVFFFAMLKANRSWSAAERAKKNEQPSNWLGVLETLIQPSVDTTGWFQLDDLREFAIGADGLLLHHYDAQASHWCTVTSTAGLDLPQIIQMAQRHECQEVMAA